MEFTQAGNLMTFTSAVDSINSLLLAIVAGKVVSRKMQQTAVMLSAEGCKAELAYLAQYYTYIYTTDHFVTLACMLCRSAAV